MLVPLDHGAELPLALVAQLFEQLVVERELELPEEDEQEGLPPHELRGFVEVLHQGLELVDVQVHAQFQVGVLVDVPGVVLVVLAVDVDAPRVERQILQNEVRVRRGRLLLGDHAVGVEAELADLEAV